MCKITVLLLGLVLVTVTAAPGGESNSISSNALRGRDIVIVTKQNQTPMTNMNRFVDELISLLQSELGFNATMEETDVNGAVDAKGQWNGMVGRLVDGTADMAIGDLTITPDRANAIDFTVPIIESGVAVLVKKSGTESLSSLEDLLRQESIGIGAVDGGSTKAFLRRTTHPVYGRFYDRIAGSCPHTFVRTVDEGVQKAKEGNFAMVMESLTIEELANNDCDIKQLGEEMEKIGYGIGMKKDSPYTSAVSEAILIFKNTGKLEELKNKHWQKNPDLDCNKTNE